MSAVTQSCDGDCCIHTTVKEDLETINVFTYILGVTKHTYYVLNKLRECIAGPGIELF